MTKKSKRVRVVEPRICHTCNGPYWFWELDIEGVQLTSGYSANRRSAIADARRFWAQFGVEVKIARKK